MLALLIKGVSETIENEAKGQKDFVIKRLKSKDFVIKKVKNTVP